MLACSLLEVRNLIAELEFGAAKARPAAVVARALHTVVNNAHHFVDKTITCTEQVNFVETY